MTDEEKAEEYAIKITDELRNKGFLTNEEINQRYAGISQGVLYGLAEGKPKWHDLREDPNDLPKEKWHDLRKNPDDLPKEGVEVLVLYSNHYDDNGLMVNKYTLRYELAQYIKDEDDLTEWYWVESGLDDMVHEVIAWCELPKFEGVDMTNEEKAREEKQLKYIEYLVKENKDLQHRLDVAQGFLDRDVEYIEMCKAVKELKAQIEKMKSFIHSEIDFCMYCPLTKECKNDEGTCPYAYATEEEQKILLMDFIQKWEKAE